MSLATPLTALPTARRDLAASPTLLRGLRYWTIKDPVALRYYQLREEEHFIWRLLDGRHTLDEIVAEFERRFAPRRLRRSELAGFLMLLHRESLVLSPAWGQGPQLAARRDRQIWQRRLAQLSNVLAIQLPGINPDRLLTVLAPRLRWIFSAWCGAAAVALVVAAGILAALHFGALVERLPHVRDFLGPANWLWLAAALALVKSLHELGHAVACKHFGGECNRLGLMLLIFTPALYCDVSDSWMFTSRWRRIAVSGAGMAVELVLAALALILWSASEPGWFNSLCLNIVFVCSVGTLLINGNPLLRYDGYYILADLLGAPNLRQQASAAIGRGLVRLLTGVEVEQPRLLAEPGWAVLWAYGLGSAAYRVLVLVAVLWFVHSVLASHGLAVVAQAIVVLTLAAVTVPPAVGGVRWLSDPARRKQIKPWRVGVAILGLIALAAAVLLVPLPSRITAPVVLRPEGARRVYVTTPGRVVSTLAAGSQVTAGQEVARLQNPALERQVVALRGRCEAQRVHLRQLELRRHDDESLGDQLPAAARLLADLQTQLAQQERELARLTLTAPTSGTVLPPPPRPDRPAAGELAEFAGTPLDEPNRGCRLESGTLVCLVGDPARLEGVAIVDESAVQRLRVGQRVRLQLAELPGKVLYGQVTEVSRLNSGELPDEIVARGMLPLERRPDGGIRSVRTYYEAVVVVDQHTAPLLINATGWARIEAAPQPLWLHIYRALRSTFRLAW